MTLDILVGVFGLSSVLVLYPMPYPLFPLMGAILYPTDPMGGALAGYMCALLFGTAFTMVARFITFGGK